MRRHRFGETPQPGRDQWRCHVRAFPHPKPPPPPDYFRQFRPCPHSAPPSFSLRSAPRRPAQTLNSFLRFHFRSRVNSPPHPQSALPAALHASSVAPPTAPASTPPLSPLPSHRSCCRSRP